MQEESEGARKNETERNTATRYLFALKDVLDNQGLIVNSSAFIKSDIERLNTKNDYVLTAERVYYKTTLTDYFNTLKIHIYFNAKQRSSASPNGLFFQKDFKGIYYQAVRFESIDAVFVYEFDSADDELRFKNFLENQTKLILPTSIHRKAFFIYGTTGEQVRWTENPLTLNALLLIANTDKKDTDFDWLKYNGITNDIYSRNLASDELVKYVLEKSHDFDEIVLIGHSHGGNVALQAVNRIVAERKKVYLITVNTPAYNNQESSKDITAPILSNAKCDEIYEITEIVPSPMGGVPVKRHYCRFKNPENPLNCKLTQHIHLWNKSDGIAGGLAGDDFYNNNTTVNIEIPTYKEYSDVIIIPTNMDALEFKNAHSLDSNRPQLIYDLIFKGIIKPIK